MTYRPLHIALFLLILFNGFAAEDDGLKRRFISMSEPWNPAPADFKLPERQHPYLFLDKEELQALFRRGTDPDLPWAQKQYAQVLKEADATLERPLKIPDLPGEWSHHYVCERCGVKLTPQGKSHDCPRCGKKYSGWPYDGVIAGMDHMKNIDNGLALGLAFQLTGKVEYALRARDTLLAYADRYTSFPIHDYQGTQMTRGARLFAQTLNEAIGIIPMAWTYDLIYDAPGTTAQHRERIVNGLLRPAALIIRRNDMSVSNWQSWHNAAIAAVGFAIEDPAMVAHSISGVSGLRFQLEKSILSDGFWYEGATSYHFYALKALQSQALAMKAAGMDAYLEPKFRKLYEAPLDYVFPDGRFPAVNDSDPSFITDEDAHYEVAYAWYGDEKFGTIAREGGRNSRDAFLYGAEQLPENEEPAGESSIFPELGAAMLRQLDTSNPLALHLDFGPHGGAHGHPDKLGIILYANGTDALPDAGRLNYGAPLHGKWYKTTLAHNTVIVDGKNQKGAEGRLVTSSFDGLVQMATAVCDTVYNDAVLTRSVALAPEYLLDVVSGESSRKRTWDLACHGRGSAECNLDLQPANLPQKSDGYQVLKNVRAADADAGFHVTFKSGEGKTLHLNQANTGAARVIVADGITDREVTTCPVVLTRKEDTSATWITVISPYDDSAVGYSCTAMEDGWHVSVTNPAGTDSYNVTQGTARLIGTTREAD